MYRLNKGLSQKDFYGLSVSKVLSPKMVESVKQDNPFDLSDNEIIGLLNLSWKYEKPMSEIFKNALGYWFTQEVKSQECSGNHKYTKLK